MVTDCMHGMQRLSEYAVRVGDICQQLSEEYQLQHSGWCTALTNCDAIVRYAHYDIIFGGGGGLLCYLVLTIMNTM